MESDIYINWMFADLFAPSSLTTAPDPAATGQRVAAAISDSWRHRSSSPVCVAILRWNTSPANLELFPRTRVKIFPAQLCIFFWRGLARAVMIVSWQRNNVYEWFLELIVLVGSQVGGWHNLIMMDWTAGEPQCGIIAWSGAPDHSPHSWATVITTTEQK